MCVYITDELLQLSNIAFAYSSFEWCMCVCIGIVVLGVEGREKRNKRTRTDYNIHTLTHTEVGVHG